MFKQLKYFLYRIFLKLCVKYFKRTAVFPLDDPVSVRVRDLIKKINKGSVILQNFDGARILAVMSAYAQKIPGDIAEVGCYRGGSARIICEFKGEKTLHLFDTFEGLPVSGQSHSKGEFIASLEGAKEYLSDCSKVYFYKGVFPDQTSCYVKDKTFSLVHLDSDLPERIPASLDFFYTRMNKGGIILIHDYPVYLGEVVDSFFFDKPESIIPITSRHAMVIKL